VRQITGGRAGIEKLYVVDRAPEILERVKVAAKDRPPGSPSVHTIVADEEYVPFQPQSVDVVITSMALHWVNDVPGVMAQCRRALKPDGLFLSALLGGETLEGLRIACARAELEREGGISPRTSPLAQMRDAGNLLGIGGFALPSVDTDSIEMRYNSAMDLVHHLRVKSPAPGGRRGAEAQPVPLPRSPSPLSAPVGS